MKEKQAHRKTPVVKAIGLVLFIVTALLVVRDTGMQQHLTADYLATLLKTAGLWALVAYVFIYAAGVCIFVPGTLLTAVAAAIFGLYLGFVVVWGGAMLGASLAFWIGRTLGRDFAASLIGSRLKTYDDAIERNGFATVLVSAPRVFSLHAYELRHGAHEGAV
ncbi:MAG: TVP38/TMEM64 family protein [Desulfosoma sp.]|uniref:TVP38/TMEM64 family protein n=1 Tax=Desulfosoma sp. TaxID=2603217 RepID=UPI004048F5B8